MQDLELSVRTLNALESAGIRTLGGLAKKKESDLMEIEGAGKKSGPRNKKSSRQLRADIKIKYEAS